MFIEDRISEAVELGFDFGSYDGSHHKMWVIDQMLRILLEDKYNSRVADWEEGEEGPYTYEWDTGIAP